MVELWISREHLVVHLVGLDRLWAFTNRLTIPFEHIRCAHDDPEIRSEGPWLGAGRTDGTLGWTVAAGPMYVRDHPGGRKTHEFWDVHDPDKAIVIELEGEPYTRLVVEVDDPERAIAFVNRHAHAADAANATASDSC